MALAAWALCTAALAQGVAGSARVANAQAGCRFVAGFAVLHDRLPDVVGACSEDERYTPSTGDTLQRTTGGLLVWRKADNAAAFTNGDQTWLMGPFGLQQRPNGVRFWWEPNPGGLPVTPAPKAGDRCHSAVLSLEHTGTEAGAGNLVGTFRFSNRSAVACTMYGYPGARLLDAGFGALPTRVERGGGYLVTDSGPSLVTLSPGGTAQFHIHWEHIPVGGEGPCPTSASLQVTPPDEYAPLTIPAAIDACGGGRLDVGAVQPVPAR